VNTKITIDGTEYNLDLAKAKELKLIRPIHKPFKVGDVYGQKNSNKTIIIQSIRGWHGGERFSIVGNRWNGDKVLNNYSCAQNITRKEMQEYIDRQIEFFPYLGNLNEGIAKLIEEME